MCYSRVETTVSTAAPLAITCDSSNLKGKQTMLSQSTDAHLACASTSLSHRLGRYCTPPVCWCPSKSRPSSSAASYCLACHPARPGHFQQQQQQQQQSNMKRVLSAMQLAWPTHTRRTMPLVAPRHLQLVLHRRDGVRRGQLHGNDLALEIVLATIVGAHD